MLRTKPNGMPIPPLERKRIQNRVKFIIIKSLKLS